MAQKKQPTSKLTFHNVPSFYDGYMKNWITHKKKQNAPAAEIAVLEDLHQLVKVAIGVLEPVPAEPEKEQK